MGWSIGYDDTWRRDIGYGVPAFCDHPKCNEEINRGLSHVCGNGEPYGGDHGCGLYFCGDHGGEGLCPRCLAYKSAYKKIKPEHPAWLFHKITDESWNDWREENPEEVESYLVLLRSQPFDTLCDMVKRLCEYQGPMTVENKVRSVQLDQR